MKEKLDFLEYSLKRNDEAIRFSEIKTGFYFGVTGLIIGFAANEFTRLREIVFGTESRILICIVDIAAIVLVIGVVISIVSSMLVLLPRLKVETSRSVLYFGWSWGQEGWLGMT